MCWIDWYHSISGNEFLVKVDLSFIMSQFNMMDLKDKFESASLFDEAMEMIQGMGPQSEDELDDKVY